MMTFPRGGTVRFGLARRHVHRPWTIEMSRKAADEDGDRQRLRHG